MHTIGDLLFFWLLLLCGGVIFASVMHNASHTREKNRKLQMMKEYPHLAGEILKSIEAQDADFDRRVQKFGNTIADALTPKEKKPKPRSGGFRIGMSILRRLMK